MGKMKKAIQITGMDIANVLGVEKEYKEALFEHELNETVENFIKSEFGDVKNNIIDNDKKHEK